MAGHLRGMTTDDSVRHRQHAVRTRLRDVKLRLERDSRSHASLGSPPFDYARGSRAKSRQTHDCHPVRVTGAANYRAQNPKQDEFTSGLIGTASPATVESAEYLVVPNPLVRELARGCAVAKET